MNEASRIGAPRLFSLDLFRGIAVAGMILVNNQGDWAHVYPAFRHAAWHGWSGADFVFPFFLFALGASLFCSLSPRLESGARRAGILPDIFRRALILIALGLFINCFPDFDLGSVRIPGVLQRIGLCYLLIALILLYAGARMRVIAAIALFLFLAYWGLLSWVTPGGIGRGSLEACGNLPGHIDGLLFRGHTYAHAPSPGFDPEGLLTTLPAVVSAMIGLFAAAGIRPGMQGPARKFILPLAGALMVAAGLSLDRIIPINKNLWTPSYILFMGGAALLLFLLLHHLFDRPGRHILAGPFHAMGRNAILIYLLSSLAGKASIALRVDADGAALPLKEALYRNLFASWLAPEAASLAYAAFFLMLWLIPALLLHRARVYVRI